MVTLPFETFGRVGEGFNALLDNFTRCAGGGDALAAARRARPGAGRRRGGRERLRGRLVGLSRAGWGGGHTQGRGSEPSVSELS